MANAWNRVIQYLREHRFQASLLVFGFIALIALVYWAIRPSNAPGWTGFGSVVSDSGISATRTLWDWLELLLIPFSVIIGVWWLGKFRFENPQPSSASSLSVRQDSTGAENQYLDNRIQAYFDKISDLLLDHRLRESLAQDEVRQVARAQTMTLLAGLDGEHKGALTKFLYESQLIQQPVPIVSLAGANMMAADLSGINLNDADLRDVQLSNAKLTDASLHKTDFSGANLSGADLRGALSASKQTSPGQWHPPNLTKTNLNEAKLNEAFLGDTDLSGASLRGTILDNADLHKAILKGADMNSARLRRANLNNANLKEAILSQSILVGAQIRGANLTNADLRQANLSAADASESNFREANLEKALLVGAKLVNAYLYGCDLNGANLKGANLRGANLSGADLTNASIEGADLRGVYLSAAKVTSEQLSTAFSLEGAIMPTNERKRLQLGTVEQADRSQYYYYQIAAKDSSK